MTETQSRSVLGRKVQAAAASRPRAGGAETWRRVLPRVAEEAIGLELSVLAVDESETTLAAAVGMLGEGDLLVGLGLTGSQGGLAIVDRQVLTALIEIQTTGRVSSSSCEPRRGTPADFALLSCVIDGWCAAVAKAGAGLDPHVTCTRLYPDARAVRLGLDDGLFIETRLELEFGGGRRKGALRLILPKGGASSAGGPDLAALEVRLLPLPTEIDAVLCRVPVPLSRVLDLSVGDVVDLGAISVRNITLEAPLGRVISRAHLGQSRGYRAARIREGSAGIGDEPEVLPVLVESGEAAFALPKAGSDAIEAGFATEVADLPDLPDILPDPLEGPS